MEGKALHKFLKLILNSTCQIGCFLMHENYIIELTQEKNHIVTLSHICLVFGKIVWLGSFYQINLFTKKLA